MSHRNSVVSSSSSSDVALCLVLTAVQLLLLANAVDTSHLQPHQQLQVHSVTDLGDKHDQQLKSATSPSASKNAANKEFIFKRSSIGRVASGNGHHSKNATSTTNCNTNGSRQRPPAFGHNYRHIRSTWDDDEQGDDEQLGRLIMLISSSLVNGYQGQHDRMAEDDISDGNHPTVDALGGDRYRRQPLDRLDEPNRWRQLLQAKLGRSRLSKRQPLDTIDEPSGWRDRLVPKLVQLASKRQPLDRLDEPSRWRSRLVPKVTQFKKNAEKRQPLDRIDEPNSWNNRMSPKLNRVGKRLRAIDGWSRDDRAVVFRRQPLDREVDMPSQWRERMIPKLAGYDMDKRPKLHSE